MGKETKGKSVASKGAEKEEADAKDSVITVRLDAKMLAWVNRNRNGEAKSIVIRNLIREKMEKDAE